MHNDAMVLTGTVRRLLVAPKQSFFLFGPRGTGKSTWLRQSFADALHIDLLNEALYQDLLVQPGLVGNMLRVAPPGSWVVIDEIQRAPTLLNEVQRFIEERRLKFALSGSSTRQLKRAGVNLLGGRALRLTMYPFVPQELGATFELEAALRYGTLAVVLASETPANVASAYSQLYLREEIQAEALVRNLPAFARFLSVAALFHGQVLNVSSLARDAGVQRTTVNDYLEILEDTLIAWRVPAWEAKVRVREQRHPKLYWVDPGMVRAAKKNLGDVSPEERGALFEGLVAMMLREYTGRTDGFEDVAYWASPNVEVDFIVTRKKSIIALEAKSSARLRDADLAGLRALAGFPHLKRRILVYGGTRVLRTEDGIDVLPFAAFVNALDRDTLL